MSGFFLRDSTSRESGYLSAPDRPDLIGKVGRAITDLRPAGTALIGDERVDVVTEGPWIEADVAVRVIQAEGYRHVVRAVDPIDASPPPPDAAAAPDNASPTSEER